MTIETQQGKKSWIGDGSTTNYPYSYPFLNASDIEVYLDGEKQASGFSVQNKPDYSTGANIIFDVAPAEGVLIVIRRNVPMTQEISYPENGEFPAKSHEKSLDKLTMLIIDNNKETLKVGPATPEDFDATFPVPEANKALKITADGKGFTMSDYDPDIALALTEDFKNQAQQAAINALSSQTAAANSEQVALQQSQNATTQAVNAKASADNAAELNQQLTNNFNTYNSSLQGDFSTYTSNLINTKEEGMSALANASNALRNTQITNCITEIPQRIKLELNDGTLTLKAGSVVIVPNGFEADGVTPKFDYVTIESDRDIVNSSPTVAQRMCWVEVPNGYGNGTTQFCFSGNTSVMNSTMPYTYSTFYNTETNKMYRGDGTAWQERPFSLPVCLATNDAATKFTSIDQVFNGFGYIGQCTWVDKGVKVLIPNGRNADGTLKNSEVVTSKITIVDLSGQNSILSFFDGVRFLGYGVDNYIVQDSQPTISTTHAMWYCPRENFVYSTSDGGATWLVTEKIYAGLLTKTEATGSITYMTPKKTFRAVDYSDLEEIGQGGTGFYKLNDGLIVQWGSVSVPAESSVVVTLPIPFSSTNYMALTSMYSNSTSGSEKNWQTSTLTTTSFKAHNGQGGTCKFGWIAAGF